MSLFITELFKNPFVYFSTVVAFMGSICFHEFCHATVAHYLGDDTARSRGFQTLNPFKVMGWKSLLCLLLFGFSWGAVPVMPEDKSRFRRSVISLAGPLSNLLLLFLSSLTLHVLRGMGVGEMGGIAYLWGFFVILLYANAVLFLFNILPIPPLDGWNTLEPFLPANLVPSPEAKGKFFMIFIYLICFSSASGVFNKGVEALVERLLPKPSAAESLVEQGNNCLAAEDFTGAYNAFSQAAEQGDKAGRLLQAQCLAEGWGCETDYVRAFEVFSEEEYSAYPLARFYRGYMLALGLGCEQDGKRGFEYLSQSDVKKNFPIARAIMGMMLSDGNGVKQDVKEAYRLLNDEELLKAVPSVTHYLAALLLSGQGCDKDAERAFSLLSDPRVLEASSAAQFMLGVICYYAGEGCEQDFKKAAEHIRAAADAGNKEAMKFLGYQDGKYVDCGIPLEELLRQKWMKSKQSKDPAGEADHATE